MSEYPRDRYQVWRSNRRFGGGERDEPCWVDLSVSEQSTWVREVEPEFNRRIREETNKDFARAPYWIGGISLFLGTCWLLNYFRILNL